CKQDIVHTYLNKNEDVTPNSASTNDTASNSGTRKRRNLATRVSTMAMTAPSAASFPRSATIAMSKAPGVSVTATPHGTNRFASKERKMKSLSDAAHSISAR